MIKKLYIQNYALINKLDLDFNAGLNVITGETGAGKSILIGALGLILGNRADISAVNSNGNKCIIEGTFDSSSKNVLSFLESNNLDIEDFLNIRREITKMGKSRAFVNDTPVSLLVLKQLSTLLVDVNSQNQSYIFRNAVFQLAILDDLSNSNKLLKEYKSIYLDYKDKQKKLISLISKEEDNKNRKDYIQFQYDEIFAANLVLGEDTALQSQLQWMDNAETIKQTLYNTTQTLSEGDEAMVEQFELLISKLSSLNNFHEKYPELLKRLESILIELQDVSQEYVTLFEETEFDPQQYIVIQERNDIILHLQQKHSKSSVEELLELMSSLDNELQSIDSISDEIEKLKVEIEKVEIKLSKKAQQLSSKRKQGIKNIESKIINSLQSLGMKDAVFVIDFKQNNSYSESGLDSVNFLFSSNKGYGPDLVSKIASGGELSRLVLSLKSLYSTNRSLPTVIFDEIDTGVSGDIASKVGLAMQNMSINMQVIAITHLPQIAAKADWHYKVYKKEKENITESDIRILADKDRLKELALMISGNSESEQALKMAAELIG